ncbi:mRNA interferase MazF [Streptomyces sp. Ag109_O5-1]|uniref:type II toxin-antitoxin system PemK/MazF family toxin n=1 Tax=Streptomyces sp. Ag109_O5-1 TaxID=1938851 RepID=UPI000F50B8C6|nr:type II toxin-antitoxin system PemK/MazF family toxin [Streptomyces sp. Ag109_O5-1]RPE38997.1 mRNA interferase MazF [Streptomyces sp. Ag109_O5-1]
MIRGGVYRIDLGDAKRGHEQKGKRLGILMSHPFPAWSTATVIPTSTRAQEAIFRPLLVIDGRETRALVDQIRTIDLQYFLDEDPVDILTAVNLAQVEYALANLMGLSQGLSY